MFISSDLKSSLLPLTANLEAVAVPTWCPNKITICSIYIPPPPDHPLNEKELVDLIFQLPHPYLLVGDFNAHNIIWGSPHTFGKGKVIENVLNCSDTFLLNTGSETHFNISSGSFSAIDLSLCDPKIAPSLSWEVFDDLHDSNHFPIIISSSSYKETTTRNFWNIKNANWSEFTSTTDILLSSLTISEEHNSKYF
ncbi:uncharacterized protein LOC126883649 [Diabrotica virgifera virgifera]|uniref:Endonuclease/exonuclease/phosphatase domain-containing protein n=1 Tax=Diabrotica virgifera virgifera TaxID=50390 RepID=A0ABM5K4Z1_DIAVI|nr:uncharacterized protein LOC126883649 [Diabrotica virgifera virgifera]